MEQDVCLWVSKQGMNNNNKSYPTVAIVTTAHQMPSKMPRQNLLENCSEFALLSFRKSEKKNNDRFWAMNFLFLQLFHKGFSWFQK